jgi:hypothetical protein
MGFVAHPAQLGVGTIVDMHRLTPLLVVRGEWIEKTTMIPDTTSRFEGVDESALARATACRKTGTAPKPSKQS